LIANNLNTAKKVEDLLNCGGKIYGLGTGSLRILKILLEQVSEKRPAEKFPILSIHDGQCLTNVQMLPQVLREMRPSRANANEAAECLEVLLRYIDKLDTLLILLRCDMSIVQALPLMPKEAVDILSILMESIETNRTDLGLD
jgi:hypothetical protein